MSKIDTYKHLNKDSKFCIELDIEDVATKIVSMNYGVHRLLSAIAQQRSAKYPNNELASEILILLGKGLY